MTQPRPLDVHTLSYPPKRIGHTNRWTRSVFTGECVASKPTRALAGVAKVAEVRAQPWSPGYDEERGSPGLPAINESERAMRPAAARGLCMFQAATRIVRFRFAGVRAV